uniref:Uncharacterized protein n=1 Tax=Romanomermis culicivorax TaxID=13658 RepID=A0A915K867_ROMCU
MIHLLERPIDVVFRFRFNGGQFSTATHINNVRRTQFETLIAASFVKADSSDQQIDKFVFILRTQNFQRGRQKFAIRDF